MKLKVFEVFNLQKHLKCFWNCKFKCTVCTYLHRKVLEHLRSTTDTFLSSFFAKKQFVIVFQNFWTRPSIIGHKSKTLRPKSFLRRSLSFSLSFSFSCKYMSKFYNQSLGHLTEKKSRNFSPLKFCSPNSLVRGRITKVGEEILRPDSANSLIETFHEGKLSFSFRNFWIKGGRENKFINCLSKQWYCIG